jgi:putative membrane protein
MTFSEFALRSAVALALWVLPVLEARGADDAAPKEAAASQLAKTDDVFLHQAWQGGLMKVQLGEIGAEKATDPGVKEIGATFAKEHSKANQELQALAERRGVVLEKELEARHRELVDRVAKLTGEKFDKAFVSEMIRSHEKGVAILEKGAASVRDADLKKFAANRLPVLKKHLQMLEAFKKGEKR